MQPVPYPANGYVLASQVNYRIANINNLSPGYNNVGATYSAELPGTTSVGTGAVNNSAKFVGSDLVIICANNRFQYSFGASDPDGDTLRYSFCEAYQTGNNGSNAVPTPNPPFQSVPYGNGFTGSTPLGSEVQINPSTGLITGIAPSAGIYVVTVCVEEIRNGKVIATQRKDLQINIAPCNIAGAILEPAYNLCKDTKTLSASNLSNSPLIHSYFWQVNNREGTILYTTTDPIINYNFADTGNYSIKLSINRGEACKDSTESIVRVYPGFKPDFTFTGICFTKPTNFKDATTSVYGQPNSWSWNFGTTETSTQQNPTYTYLSEGTRDVRLIVTNTLGCADTLIKPIAIVKEPPINLLFKDTLICTGDSTTLLASGTGTFTWSPSADMVNSNTGTPTVAPVTTATYTTTMNDNGCIGTGSVLVRVTDHVELQVMPDTTICRGDTVQLSVISDGFKYLWSPANQVTDPRVRSPYVVTNNATTTYSVTANIGSCVATEEVKIATIPYPVANAGNDTIICFSTEALLHGQTNGTSFRWAPTVGLTNPSAINTIVTPRLTTRYTLFAYDTLGCPKPATDDVLITILDEIVAFAGRDTSIIINQPLQLNATGGATYVWTPSFGLSATNIPDPVVSFDEPTRGIKYLLHAYNEAGCVDTTSINVMVFNTAPSIFVPTAFTPNKDRKNDVLRPIAVGIKQMEFFSIFNRWGQLVFTTKAHGNGWDGSINGKPQASGTYVWMVKATDYNNTPYFEKGTVVLIK